MAGVKHWNNLVLSCTLKQQSCKDGEKERDNSASDLQWDSSILTVYSVNCEYMDTFQTDFEIKHI